jgi:hypothetical protein
MLTFSGQNTKLLEHCPFSLFMISLLLGIGTWNHKDPSIKIMKSLFAQNLLTKFVADVVNFEEYFGVFVF